MLVAALLMGVGAMAPQAASAKPALAVSSGTRWACPKGSCDAIIISRIVKRGGGYALPGSNHIFDGSGERRGLDPQDLQSAYRIPATISSPQTIALIDAYGYPDAESDLAKYRERYGLPPCTQANGCFRKVNQSGQERAYPKEEEGWDEEAALDEDMASAACPQCHILMVEGSGERPAQLGAAVNTAARLGATEVSNSYGYPELEPAYCGKSHCATYGHDYAHPGVLITASAGDSG